MVPKVFLAPGKALPITGKIKTNNNGAPQHSNIIQRWDKGFLWLSPFPCGLSLLGLLLLGLSELVLQQFILVSSLFFFFSLRIYKIVYLVKKVFLITNLIL
jgi:hypothetical protein